MVVKGVDVLKLEFLFDVFVFLVNVFIDLLINNVGVLGKEGLGDWDFYIIDY